MPGTLISIEQASDCRSVWQDTVDRQARHAEGPCRRTRVREVVDEVAPARPPVPR
ncbi:hypothetical protein SFR_0211 [Streptomyces sp. FR-008]|nr:hypothetical protein SFR_0211 [Streptomyces sp. FR-008]